MRLHIKEFADFCDVNQILELNTILSFKKLGFTLKEIKEMKKRKKGWVQ